jgi:hypothetical protein
MMILLNQIQSMTKNFLALAIFVFLGQLPAQAQIPQTRLIEMHSRRCSQLSRDYFKYAGSHPEIAKRVLEEMKQLQCVR